MAAVCTPPSVDPLSRLRNLSQLGSSVSVDNNVPPRRYLRSGLEMERMANVYLEEGNLEHAFVLYSKLITLIVEKLPKHIHYKDVPASNRHESKKRVTKAFQRAEDLKEALRKKYEEEFEAWKIQEAEKKKELEREEQERLKQQEKEKEIEREKELEKQKIKEQNESNNHNVFISANVIPSSLTPSIKAEEPALPKFTQETTLPHSPQHYPVLNEISEKPTDKVERTAPAIDRGTKPSFLDFVTGLRTLNVPTQLMRKFIDVASPNTRQNRETCGILAGKLRQNVFHITHLIIPKQTSTSDSCTTLNEEDIFVYQDTHDLITLGWIHTHPSQTAFMSSVDLHTHCSYQLMLPEALAIVCAPKHSQTGMFSLTTEYGLKFIAACKQQGFHPHPKEPPIYEESAHVKLDQSSSITIADLR